MLSMGRPGSQFLNSPTGSNGHFLLLMKPVEDIADIPMFVDAATTIEVLHNTSKLISEYAVDAVEYLGEVLEILKAYEIRYENAEKARRLVDEVEKLIQGITPEED